MIKKSTYDRRNTPYTLIVISCCGTMIASTGISNCYGILLEALARNCGTSIGTISLGIMCKNVALALAVLPMPKVLDRVGSKRVILAGGLTVIVSIAMQAVSHSVTAFFVASILHGVANALLGMSTVNMLIDNWFVEKRGLASGIAVSSSGLFGAVMNPVFNRILEKLGLPLCMLMMAVCVFLVCIPGVLFADDRPAVRGLRPKGYRAEIMEDIRQKNEEQEESIKLGFPLMVFLFLSFSTAFMTGMSQHLPNFAVSIGYTLSLGSYMASSAMYGNLLFKILIGILCDKIKPFNTLCIALLGICLSFVLFLEFKNVYAFLIIASFFFGATFGVCNVGGAQYMHTVYNEGIFPKAYNRYLFAMNIGTASSYAVIGILFDCFGSYTFSHILCLCLSMLCLILLVLLEFFKKCRL